MECAVTNDLLDALREFDALRDGERGGDEIAQDSLSAITPEYADGAVLGRLNRAVADAVRAAGIERIYRHQSEAIDAALKGENVVLQAPTASGKSLAFQIPLLNTLANDRDGHALMIFPTKALSLDQREQLRDLTTRISGRRIESWWFDGDTESEHRKALKDDPPQILITTPDMLHASFLGYADQWQSFLRNLKWVIVDEMHEYRGYFGSNVAMILRRLSHHLAEQGARPQFFLCSATCANANEHAKNLTGLDFTEVNASSSMRPHRDFFFVRPDIPDHQYWDVLQIRAVNAGLACVQGGKAVLVFCPTREFAESCHQRAMWQVEQLHSSRSVDIDKESIKVFRAGLSTEMRHDIQQGLRDGSVRLAFTTNALELGIDIGGLDGVILAGFPDSMMSAWQRIGRAGRSWASNAFVLYYARNNPLDQFYAANLPTFLQKPLDDLVVNPGNEELIERHLPCLLYETPSLDSGGDVLGEPLMEAVTEATAKGHEPVRTGRWRPHRAVNIRGSATGTYVLRVGSEEIGTLSNYYQFRDAFPRAIYMHGGSAYRVDEVAETGNGGEVRLSPTEPHLRTRPSIFTTVQENEIYAGRRWHDDAGDVLAFYGKVSTTEMLAAVEEVDERSGNVVDHWKPDGNDAQYSNAHACWIERPELSPEAQAGITALQHLLRVGVLFSIPIDAHDMFPHVSVKQQRIYVIESYPGGIGIARKVLEKWQDMLRAGIQVAVSCDCARGCPNCIMPPRSRDELDKRAGIRFAETLLTATGRHHDAVFAQGLWKPA